MPDCIKEARLLPHKLAAPKPHRNAVERRRILGKLTNLAGKRVVLIQSPAGHGKTSLMLQVEAAARAQGVLTCWVSIDETDNDVRRIQGQLQFLLASLSAQSQHDNWEDAANSGEHGAVETASGSNWLATTLLELGKPVTIFLDDLHFVSNQSSLLFLRQLIADSPPNVLWYIASRTMPDLGISRLVVNDEALILHAEDMRFSQEEIRVFFEQVASLDLSDDEREAIYRATEGWPAALQLYRLALESPSVRATLRSRSLHQPRELADYLADNVLSRQSADIQEFLLKTSLLQRMSAPLCDAVLGRKDSLQLLSSLERAGLFVRRLESDDNWFTYHAIFSRFLHDQLRAEHSESIADIHRRSADWYMANRCYEDAIHHYCAAREYSKAADAFDVWTDKLIPEGQMVTVERWSDQMPLAELEKRPGLATKIVWALTFLSRHRKQGPLLNILRSIPPNTKMSADATVASCMVRLLEDDLSDAAEMVAGIGTTESGATPYRQFELSAVSNCRGYAAMAAGNFDAALSLLAHGRDLSDRAGATFTWAYSIGKTAITLVAQGRLQEALVRFRASLSDPRMFLAESISRACLTSGYIMALYEADQLDAALTHFEQVHEALGDAFIHDYLATTYVAIAHIYDVRGQPDRALKTLDEAEERAYVGHWPRVARIIKWARVHRELLAGRPAEALIISGHISGSGGASDPNWVRFSEDTGGEAIGRIRLDIHTGSAAKALQMLEPLQAEAESRGRIHRQIKLFTLAALAEAELGHDEAAHHQLERALRLAAPGGYMRGFLEEGEPMARLLLSHARLKACADPAASQCSCERSAQALLVRLVQSTSGETSSVSEPSPANEPGAPAAASLAQFTRRERAVLSMLVNYAPNEQMAAAMHITKDTLKYHLKNVYGKLYVKTRLEAIRVARDMGLK